LHRINKELLDTVQSKGREIMFLKNKIQETQYMKEGRESEVINLVSPLENHLVKAESGEENNLKSMQEKIFGEELVEEDGRRSISPVVSNTVKIKSDDESVSADNVISADSPLFIDVSESDKHHDNHKKRRRYSGDSGRIMGTQSHAPTHHEGVSRDASFYPSERRAGSSMQPQLYPGDCYGQPIQQFSQSQQQYFQPLQYNQYAQYPQHPPHPHHQQYYPPMNYSQPYQRHSNHPLPPYRCTIQHGDNKNMRYDGHGKQYGNNYGLTEMHSWNDTSFDQPYDAYNGTW